MIDIKDRICDAVAGKVMSAEAATDFIHNGDNLGVSGFTPSGYPKAVPLALSERYKGTDFKVNVWTGASVGPEIDQAMVEAGIMDRRLPYQTNGTLRKAINEGKVKYADIHLSHMAQMVRYGFMANRKGVDVAIVEVCKIKDLGDGKVGLIPTTSMGNSSSYVAGAKKLSSKLTPLSRLNWKVSMTPMYLLILRTVNRFLSPDRKTALVPLIFLANSTKSLQ